MSLDLLRGIAICGIVPVNLLDFSGLDQLFLIPAGSGGLERALWLALIGLGLGKFISILSMLFGAGLALSSQGLEARGERPFLFVFARLGWLWFFGMLHAYLLWHGDILVTYAIIGFVVYFCRNWSPRWLGVAGTASLAVIALLIAGIALAVQFVGEFGEFGEWKALAADDEFSAATREAFAQGWPEQWLRRAYYSMVLQFVGILFCGFWVVGMMLWGIALLRRGRFETKEGPGPPLRRAAMALSTGGVVSVVGWILIARAQGATAVVFAGIVPLYMAIPFIAIGYAHLVVAWAARRAAPGLLRRSLTALGRMALSNYLGQSLLLGLVFYGHGLGLIGRLSFLETMAIAPLVWGLQLAISTWWLRHFAQGPMEWLWRCLAQGRRLPMRIQRP